MEQGWPILLVTHDAEEHKGWQFLNGHGDTEHPSNGIPVHVKHVPDRNPSVLKLADLPQGWRASRQTQDAVWVRAPRE